MRRGPRSPWKTESCLTHRYDRGLGDKPAGMSAPMRPWPASSSSTYIQTNPVSCLTRATVCQFPSQSFIRGIACAQRQPLDNEPVCSPYSRFPVSVSLKTSAFREPPSEPYSMKCCILPDTLVRNFTMSVKAACSGAAFMPICHTRNTGTGAPSNVATSLTSGPAMPPPPTKLGSGTSSVQMKALSAVSCNWQRSMSTQLVSNPSHFTWKASIFCHSRMTPYMPFVMP
mmetsp:Transcript_57974/g.147185  ORF Transcript_57974/g.147185 Transcript_57974/m.147185 type:complete len:228 (+) Transcript_57974:118-801(+)